jgi:hypothetical protein
VYPSRILFRQNSLCRCLRKLSTCWKQGTGKQIFVVSSPPHNADNEVYNSCDTSFTVIFTRKPSFSTRLPLTPQEVCAERYGFPDSPMRTTCSKFEGWVILRLLPLKCCALYALGIMLKLMLGRVTNLICYGTIIPLYDFYIEMNRRMHYEATISTGMLHLQIHVMNLN